MRSLRVCVEEGMTHGFSTRDADRAAPPGAFRARRDWLITTLATSITVLTAAIAILVAAAAAVVITIT